MNPQRQGKQKVKGDKSQYELTQINKEFSVLKVTEELKVGFKKQNASRTGVLRGIIPYKEMCPAIKKAGTAPLARSPEITNLTEVMFKITEDNGWLNEYTLSDEPSSDNDCKVVKSELSKVPPPHLS